jgi:hypothetical protein
MPQLLHEYWESETGGWFGPVREENEPKRPLIVPNARLVFSVWASSWHEAKQAEHERLGFGPYAPDEGVENHFYTDQEAAKQAAYLLVRRFSGD